MLIALLGRIGHVTDLLSTLLSLSLYFRRGCFLRMEMLKRPVKCLLGNLAIPSEALVICLRLLSKDESNEHCFEGLRSPSLAYKLR